MKYFVPLAVAVALLFVVAAPSHGISPMPRARFRQMMQMTTIDNTGKITATGAQTRRFRLSFGAGDVTAPMDATQNTGNCCARHHILSKGTYLQPFWNAVIDSGKFATLLKPLVSKMGDIYFSQATDRATPSQQGEAVCDKDAFATALNNLGAATAACRNLVGDLWIWNSGIWFAGPKPDNRSDDPGPAVETGAGRIVKKLADFQTAGVKMLEAVAEQAKVAGASGNAKKTAEKARDKAIRAAIASYSKAVLGRMKSSVTVVDPAQWVEGNPKGTGGAKTCALAKAKPAAPVPPATPARSRCWSIVQ